MLHLSAKRHRSIIWWEDALWKTFWQPFKGPILPFGSLVEYHPFTANDQSRIRRFGKKVLPGLFLGCALYAGGIWKGDVLIADLEELETMDASEIYSKRLHAKEVKFPKQGEFIFSNRRWTNQNPWRRSGTENIHLGTASTNSRRGSHWLWWRIRRVSSTISRLTSGCWWSHERFLVHVGKLQKPPSRWTTSQTLLAERGIIPYSTEVHWRNQNYSYELGCQAGEAHWWLLEYRWIKRFVWFLGQVSRNLFWMEEKPPDGYMWSGERLTRKQLTSRPDHLWPELWKSMGKHAKRKEKQKRSNEKLHLENLRKLRGSISSTQRTRNWKKTIKNACKKLETSVALAMPSKIVKNCGSGTSNKIQTKLACILEADESTRMRMVNSIPPNHEDHIAGKGENSLQHYNLVHKFNPMPQAMKNPSSKSSSGQGMGKIGENFGVELDESQK